MCIVMPRVPDIARTRIFAGALAGGRQALVYSMTITVSEDVAMLLPLPVPPGSPEDAVRFVSFEAYPKFFDDLERAFPGSRSARYKSRSLEPTLRVHKVGKFEASFVPTAADFDRLDPRFRLPDAVWRQLADYHDWGFAVFKLAVPLSKASEIHPMAFDFPRRDPDRLFFPTVHVHDGDVHATAEFDHTLYAQSGKTVLASIEESSMTRWNDSQRGARCIDIGRTGGLVDATAWLFRLRMHGTYPNRDVWASGA